LEVFAGKPNMRVLDDRERGVWRAAEPGLREVVWGMLVKDRDNVTNDRTDMKVVSKRHQTESEWEDLEFAWKACKHVRSNAIVIALGGATVGIGAGQMSRVDSVRLAIEKARSSLQGGALASDAYFPFSDGPGLAMSAGVSAIIQPGGSIRDQEVIDAVDAAGAATGFTGRRHFRH